MEGPPLPKTPPAGQAKPPCGKLRLIRQVDLNGACWVRLADPQDGKCGGVGFVHEGHCYAPVDGKTRPAPS